MFMKTVLADGQAEQQVIREMKARRLVRAAILSRLSAV